VIDRLSPVPIRSRKFAVSCSVDAAEACSTDTTKWNDFDQVGVKACSSMHAWCWLLLQKHRT